MKFTNLVEEMKTVRDFKKEAVDKSLIQKVIEAGNRIKGIVEDAKVSIMFIENGKEAYKMLSGKAGYYGKMMEAPHYMAIVTEAYPYAVENSGYIMEWMRLKAWELGLGTCWLNVEDGEDVKKTLGIKEAGVITSFIAIGVPYTGIFKKDTSQKPSRMSIKDLVYLEEWGNPCSIEYLDTRAMTNIFYYTKLAPSWGNKQPWRFIIDRDRVLLIMSKEQQQSMRIDSGIVMLYFQKAAEEEGITGKWELAAGEVMERKYNIPQEYVLIGYYGI
ncbi:nitroreductase family protein [Clostridium formicaceticum]|uniref:Putative nitroreductase TM1586 domain-containing protein n=1 Tax=Clostridium formicaceticum TaxID=1497 RepID=A0AAC9RI54_9CLOT|nr:nitroreductase family protein [Clostridium formicaceticum]AOY75913.1 hypothetical protein BJL90_08405 [Clostridium formicaceticum]ARE86257.1 hypothetical protein CLFO_05790 [Clostridium formicaceticum]